MLQHEQAHAWTKAPQRSPLCVRVSPGADALAMANYLVA
jgi:hypothetical protein